MLSFDFDNYTRASYHMHTDFLDAFISIPEIVDNPAFKIGQVCKHINVDIPPESWVEIRVVGIHLNAVNWINNIPQLSEWLYKVIPMDGSNNHGYWLHESQLCVLGIEHAYDFDVVNF